MTDQAKDAAAPEVAWLIESAIHDSNGPYYLCVSKIHLQFEWKPDHLAAIRFGRKEDAERVRDAVRELCPYLFPSINPMPQAVQHNWSAPMTDQAKDAARTCNRHVDCDAAEAELLARNPGKTKADIHLSFHCYDEDCEDCFGQ